MMDIRDAKERQIATCPNQSFIVEAPAGSGKTELLTQRYLRLLATVKHPAAIVALTFTKKAQEEMRSRILKALQDAKEKVTPTSIHAETTQSYAKAVLAQDEAYQWRLHHTPSLLKIMTIDAFCRQLTQLKPLTNPDTMFANIATQPKVLYETAVRNFLQYTSVTPPYQNAIFALREHLDNREEKLIEQLCQLLINREQWLPILYEAKTHTPTTRTLALATLCNKEYERFVNTLPAEQFSILRQLLEKMAWCDARTPSPLKPILDWQETGKFSEITALTLFNLLMTQEKKLRKKFDHHTGLIRKHIPHETYRELQKQSEALFLTLNTHTEFLGSLKDLACFPPSEDHSCNTILLSLFTLLPLLVAHLEIVFKEQNTLDFTAISEQASAALGPEDQPTDLALYLDTAISHLLIDEFQDTSVGQYHLLSRLIAGWEAHDGRTLFIVGDPMQSIYRFREAEVSLFLKVQKEGIGRLSLTPLSLCTNFRSDKKLIEWVNEAFDTIFPKIQNIDIGAVTFQKAFPMKLDNECLSPIQAYFTTSQKEEAASLLKIIQSELNANDKTSIAILVRSRNLLWPIIQLLKHHQIPYEGTEIEKLANAPHIQDALTITKALLIPDDAIAWCAFLRSPWCGLSLQDIHQLRIHAPSKSLRWTINLPNIREKLSKDGQTRLNYIYQIVEKIYATRYQMPLSEWILTFLQKINMIVCLKEHERSDLEAFFQLMTEHETHGSLLDIKKFENALLSLFAAPQKESRLKIMTIHKSKGLEFDIVILPSLGHHHTPNNAPLFHFTNTIVTQKNPPLIAPIPANDKINDPLYDYLSHISFKKEAEETKRLFYVAVTRAKKKLYLLDAQETPKNGSFRALLKAITFEAYPTDIEETKPPISTTSHTLKLPLSYYETTLKAQTTTLPQKVLLPQQDEMRYFGIILHEALEWIGCYQPKTLEKLPWSAISHRFKMYGYLPPKIDVLLNELKETLKTVFTLPLGKFIMAAHEDAKTEYPLLIMENGKLKTYVIDRTFSHNGIRWIIDFKTGYSEETIRPIHEAQLNQYASLFSKITKQPLRCVLFYLKMQDCQVWDYQKITETL